MYSIPIDELHYHANILTKKEKAYGVNVYLKTLKRYPTLRNFVSKTVKPLALTQSGEEELLGQITLAFCRVLKEKAVSSEDELLAKIKRWLHSFLPYIVQNLRHSYADHPVQYEPVAMAAFYAVDLLLAHFQTLSLAKEDSDFEGFYLWEFCNWFRALRSSLLLLNHGDDVHGIALLRGSLEILAKLIHAQNFPKEYVLFKNFNVHQQALKFSNTPLPQYMADFLENEPDYRKNKENFLSYAWARNKKGNRILTMHEFIKTAISAPLQESLYALSSEFVHEDYVGVGYDYISIRKGLIDYYYALLHLLPELLSESEETTIGKQLAHLFLLVDPIYTGDTPLQDFKLSK